jgi:hypothetical protein
MRPSEVSWVWADDVSDKAMTEEEAKQRWCPFTRSGAADSAGINRSLKVDETLGVNPEQRLVSATRCLGSGCMAWRVNRDVYRDMNTEITGQTLPSYGYCGLAGKP